MTWNLEPGLRGAIKALLDARKRYLVGSAEWSVCDEILHDICIREEQARDIAEELDEYH